MKFFATATIAALAAFAQAAPTAVENVPTVVEVEKRAEFSVPAEILDALPTELSSLANIDSPEDILPLLSTLAGLLESLNDIPVLGSLPVVGEISLAAGAIQAVIELIEQLPLPSAI